jgi:hypothetical protein
MVDPDTFLTTVYVMVADFCPSQLPPEVHSGPRASLRRREVITLGLCGQWACFPGERAFSRDAPQHLRAAFPTRPHRTPFNRLWRRHDTDLLACFLHLVELLDGRHALYEARDRSAVPTRDAKRRGGGWLPGLAAIGWRNRLGWSEGFPRLLAVNPRGASPVSASDRPAARIRRWPKPSLPCASALIRAVGALGSRLGVPMSVIKASKDTPHMRAGGIGMVRR